MKKLFKWLQWNYWVFPAQLYMPVLWFKGFYIRWKYIEDNIPRNDYCYRLIKAPCIDNKWCMKIKPCPYLDINKLASQQSYGYCHLLKAGDWQHKGTSLLWDQCKECGINNSDESEY